MTISVARHMRAAIMRQKQIIVDQLPVPEPGAGQVLVKTLACGICGSDLHMLKRAPAWRPRRPLGTASWRT